MRLHVAVREGDWTTTQHGPFAGRIAWAMRDLPGFTGAADAGDRWARLDHSVLKHTCVVEAEPGDSLQRLKEAAVNSAKQAGLLSETTAEAAPPASDSIAAHWIMRQAEQNAEIWLADPATGERLDGQGTVGEAGLGDQDLVVLNAEHDYGIGYMMGPAANPRELFAWLQLLAQRSEADQERPCVRGVLLYTEADVELASYVRRHFDELNVLSGITFEILVAERPSNWRSAKRYWREHLPPAEFRCMAALQWLIWKPFEKYRVYEVAQRLGVGFDQLPCLVLTTYPTSRENLVFPIHEVSVKTFRTLFQALHEVVEDGPVMSYDLVADLEKTRGYGPVRRSPRLNGGTEAAWSRLRAGHARLLSELTPVQGNVFTFRGSTVFVNRPGGQVSEQFNFHGQTTFVNRPTNTVISDFQNTYTGVAGQAELQQLLRLILQTGGLSDEDRERGALLVHETAAEIATPQPDKSLVKGRLDALAELATGAADIAGPAAVILHKVLQLAGLG
jgi:hypothetical protein